MVEQQIHLLRMEDLLMLFSLLYWMVSLICIISSWQLILLKHVHLNLMVLLTFRITSIVYKYIIHHHLQDHFQAYQIPSKFKLYSYFCLRYYMHYILFIYHCYENITYIQWIIYIYYILLNHSTHLTLSYNIIPLINY